MRNRRAHVSEAGMRLDRFVRIHFADVPHGQIQALWRQGRITIDGKPARPGDTLAAGAEVGLRTPSEPPAAPPPAPLTPAERARLKAMTLYEDADLLVLDKPSGLAVHAGTGTTADLDALLARLVDPASGERPVLIHRLDKDTSGVIVAAKRKAVAQRLGKALAAHALVKTYIAVVEGELTGDGVIDLPLAKRETPAGGRVVIAAPTDPDAKPARTEWIARAQAPDGSATLVELSPLTGRTHQLRAHLKAIGHAIRGDRLHGGPAPEGALPRLHLHAWRLRLPASWPGPFEAPWPGGFWRTDPASPA
jgi:RluA family pseudouridine synthase